MRLGETMYIARARTGSMCTSRRPDGAVDGGLLRRLGDWRRRWRRYRRRGRGRYGLDRRNRYGHGRRPGRRRVGGRRGRRGPTPRWARACVFERRNELGVLLNQACSGARLILIPTEARTDICFNSQLAQLSSVLQTASRRRLLQKLTRTSRRDLHGIPQFKLALVE